MFNPNIKRVKIPLEVLKNSISHEIAIDETGREFHGGFNYDGDLVEFNGYLDEDED